MKILIACSKHFYNRIPKIKRILEEKGHETKMPNSYENAMKEEELKKQSKEEHIKWKAEMMKKDEKNIKPQDAILVLNFEKKGIPNYIRGATFLEIYTAWKLNKKIYLYNPLPNCSFTDELIGINPIILNGDLDKIK
jgi:hypothetical protein